MTLPKIYIYIDLFFYERIDRSMEVIKKFFIKSGPNHKIFTLGVSVRGNTRHVGVSSFSVLYTRVHAPGEETKVVSLM